MKLSQIFKTEPSSLTFLNLDNLRWVDFLDILKTQQYSRLDNSYKPNKKYSEKQLSECSDAWNALQDEVFLLEDTADARALIRKSMDRLILTERIKLIESDANILVWYGNQEQFFKINDRGDEWLAGVQKIYATIKNHDKRIKIQYFEPIEVNLKTLERVVASLLSEYNTKHKDVDDKVTKKERTLQFEVLQVNIICPGINLDMETMSCTKWIEAKKIAKEMNKPKLTSNPE